MSGITGRLEDESLLEIVEPVLKSGATAHLSLKLGNHTGEIYFENGHIVHAVSTALEGKEAAYNLMSWRSGEWGLKKGAAPAGKTVDIGWMDFSMFFEEEIEKIVLSIIPEIVGGLYLDMRSFKGRRIYTINRLEDSGAEKDLNELLTPSELKGAVSKLRSGEVERLIKRRGGHMLFARYLKELRYYVFAVFSLNGDVGKYNEWLENTFEPKVLDAVSLAMEKADKTALRGTILVIDDSPTTRAILEDTLSQYRFNVITAEDGYEGLVKMKEVMPDLIFLDVMMPKIDGYEVLRKVRADKETAAIPVVMLTSKELAKDEGVAFKEGANLYIEKPFTTKKILTIVENVLGLE